MAVSNASPHKAACPFEAKATQAPKEKTGMTATNSGGFENRVMQESGQH